MGTFEQRSSGLTGFAYKTDGASEPAAPSNFATLDVLDELRNATAAEDGKAPWKSCLVRIEREGSRIVIEFEYDDVTRWAITRAHSQARAQELRPR